MVAHPKKDESDHGQTGIRYEIAQHRQQEGCHRRSALNAKRNKPADQQDIAAKAGVRKRLAGEQFANRYGQEATGGHRAAGFVEHSAPAKRDAGPGADPASIVLFPVTAPQRHGMEDLRLVRFAEDDGEISYFGTYCAFSGFGIREELLRTKDFATFELSVLRGAVAATKGLALFPRRIDGKFAMLGRQDHEGIWFLQSSDLATWEIGKRIIAPRFPWELVQIGNCGCPIQIAEGWLVILHGVGPVRNYSIGACLLDRADPSRLLARTSEPLISTSPKNRDGYVPNVVYSCGGVAHGRTLFLPYGVADSCTAFATVDLDGLLRAMH